MKRGFTLIELLVILTIFGVLLSLVNGVYSSSLKRGRDQDRKNDIKQYQIALENYANNNESVYPIFASTTSAASTVCPVLVMQNCPEDPKKPDDASFTYNYQSSGNGLNWVLWAKIESSLEYWVVCSNRKSGEKSIAGFSVIAGVCPL